MEIGESNQFSDDESQHLSDSQNRNENRSVNQVTTVSTSVHSQSKPIQHKQKTLFHHRSGPKNRDLKTQIQSLRRQVRPKSQ